MQFTTLLGLAASLVLSEAASLGSGFNYGSTNPSGDAMEAADFEALFKRAQELSGPATFNSARLYTMIQDGTTNTPISAIEAAISTKTTLLLGMWASGGQTDIDNEITALKTAISTYGSDFTDLVVGLSVGSEDLYRDSTTGVENNDGVGATPATITSYISQVKSAIAGTAASGFSIGHVDTWDAWSNSSNVAVADACDWLGVDEYPYFQYQDPNDISDAKTLFWNAYNVVKAVAGDKDVFITESGWPVSGPNEGEAVASVANAETYWQEIACALFGHYNTWWYTLQDSDASYTPSPSFGIIGATLSSDPLYNLQCNASTTNSSVTATSAGSSATSTASSNSTGTSVASASGSGVPYPSGNGTSYTATGTPSAGSSATGSAATGSATSTGSTSSQTGAANTIGYASSAAILAIFGAVAAF